MIGRSVARLEDLALRKGAGCFVADLSFPFQLHLRLLRSPIAHGRLIGIDAAAALALPGVVAVWTADDIPDVPPVDFRDPSAEVLLPYRQPVLAREFVRYVGEPVAAVFADDPYCAEDAADLIRLEIEPLPVVTSASQAPGQFDNSRSTEATILKHGYGNIDRAFASAHTIVELDLAIGRHSAVPMETRGAIGVYEQLPTSSGSMVPPRFRIVTAIC
jgi:carbon-monoxide dehydrogenase large subunit/6-hydroxypseudooxynicotine dehydrogenase subunit gamma